MLEEESRRYGSDGEVEVGRNWEQEFNLTSTANLLQWRIQLMTWLDTLNGCSQGSTKSQSWELAGHSLDLQSNFPSISR